MSNENLTEKTLADVKAGIPARDAEIEKLRKENAELREQLDAIGAGGVKGRLMPGANADRETIMRSIVQAGQRAGIIRADLESASVSECLHILECLGQPAAPVGTEPVGMSLEVRTLGNYGAAFDPPGNHRAYTYEHQPGNIKASRLGNACRNAAAASAGDTIDRGLGLLKELQDQGFGVFEVEASRWHATPVAAQPQPEAITDAVMQVYHRTPVGDALDYSDIYDAVKAVLAAPVADQAVEPKLDKPAKVGGVRFGTGIKWSTVIKAAQRLYAYEVTPEKEAERIAGADQKMQALRHHIAAQGQQDAETGKSVLAGNQGVTSQDAEKVKADLLSSLVEIVDAVIESDEEGMAEHSETIIKARSAIDAARKEAGQ